MTTIFLHHKVADYDAWRPHYDADRPRRKKAGLTDLAVLRNADDANDVVLVWEAESEDRAREMIADEGLAKRMDEAGVLTRPVMWLARIERLRPPTHPMPNPFGRNVDPQAKG